MNILQVGTSTIKIPPAKYGGTEFLVYRVSKHMVGAGHSVTILDIKESEEMRAHPVIGRDILAPISQFQGISEIVYYHHERYNGEGYPEGLMGEDIPLLSRIIAVADTYDAMTSTRAYREKIDREKTIEEIKSNSGSQFDPKVVEAFLRVVDRLDNDEIC